MITNTNKVNTTIILPIKHTVSLMALIIRESFMVESSALC